MRIGCLRTRARKSFFKILSWKRLITAVYHTSGAQLGHVTVEWLSEIYRQVKGLSIILPFPLSFFPLKGLFIILLTHLKSFLSPFL